MKGCFLCPHRDSNTGLWLRRPTLYPLSYRGNAGHVTTSVFARGGCDGGGRMYPSALTVLIDYPEAISPLDWEIASPPKSGGRWVHRRFARTQKRMCNSRSRRRAWPWSRRHLRKKPVPATKLKIIDLPRQNIYMPVPERPQIGNLNNILTRG